MVPYIYIYKVNRKDKISYWKVSEVTTKIFDIFYRKKKL